ncbi:MAG: AAA family ATPase [Pseudomonadota bacterium]
MQVSSLSWTDPALQPTGESAPFFDSVDGMTHHILITGCSGGGKSTLAAALAERGYHVVPEPGLRVVQEERESGGTSLPWVDMSAFLWRALDMAKADLARMAHGPHPVFYDRGLLDAAVGLKDMCSIPFSESLGPRFPYSKRVILVPPWRDIYRATEDRQHSFDEATREYDRILRGTEDLGCEMLELPCADLQTRVGIVESAFGVRGNDD